MSYGQAKDVARLKRDGMLVSAEITKYRYDKEDSVYTLYYEYTDEAGTVYTGSTGRKYGSYELANAHYGERIDIYIGADGESIRADFPDQRKFMHAACVVLWCVLGADACAAVGLGISLFVTRQKGAMPTRRPLKRILGVVGVIALFALLFAGVVTQRAWLLILPIALAGALGLIVSIIYVVGIFVGAGKAARSLGKKRYSHAADDKTDSAADTEDQSVADDVPPPETPPANEPLPLPETEKTSESLSPIETEKISEPLSPIEKEQPPVARPPVKKPRSVINRPRKLP